MEADLGLDQSVLSLLAELSQGDDPFGPDSGLRESGLDSLAVTRLWFSLRQRFGVDIPVPWLGRCRTAGQLIDRVRAEVGEHATAAPDPVVVDPATGGGPDERFGPFALTDLQQAYLIGRDPRLGPDPVGCHVYREFEVPDLDVAKLHAAWQRVCDRHGMLRVELTPDGRQRVREPGPVPAFPVHDGSGQPADGFRTRLDEVRDRLTHRRYPDGAWPLYTIEVSLAPAAPAIVHLSIEALLTDGHGLGVVLDDWGRYYHAVDQPAAPSGHAVGVPADPTAPPERTARPDSTTRPDSTARPSPDRPPELTARDCVRALTAGPRGPEYRRAVAYWSQRLAGLPAGPDLGALHTGPAGQRRAALTAVVDRAQWRVASELAAAWEVSPTALVLTLFAEAFGWQRVPRPFTVVLTTNHRGRLPPEADDVVGPFTSSMVVPIPDTLDRPLREAARIVHDQLWQDLAHSAVSGVAALRAVRVRGGDVPPLPVVFTSMLGTGRPESPYGFAGSVGYACSQTAGVALDHQMWERDGHLHVRWDVVPDLFPDDTLPVLFARFLNSLYELGTEAPEQRPMNELQQAYYVPRVFGAPAAWDGCQVYHSFEVDDLDLDRLTGAWLRLAAAYEPLRTVVTRDGQLAVAAGPPRHREIPVVDLAALPDPDGYRRRLRDRMAGRATPLGRGPQHDILVTRDAPGRATVHLTTDLTILDGRSIHFLVRELFRLYADPAATPAPTLPHAAYLAERATLAGDPRRPAWVAHWRDRVAALPPGPVLSASTPVDPAGAASTSVDPAGADPAPVASAGETAPGDRALARIRREGRVTGWAAVRARAERAGLTPDDLLVAAFTQALAEHYPTPFSVPVVRWTAATARYRPGEYTALSWVTRDDPGRTVWAQAAAVRQTITADLAADAVSGLGELRRRVMRERRTGRFDLPVVYTGLLELTGQPLPDGVRLGEWLTCTPDVSLDCIGIEEGDELRFFWDAVAAHFPPGRLDTMFGRYRALIEELTGADAVHREVGAVARRPRQTGEPHETGGTRRDVTDELRHRMLYEWNDTTVDFPTDRQVHLLFEDQAGRRPDAVAVRWRGGTMTYGEVNRRANRLAQVLRRAGVGPEVAVGISVPRGPDLVCAVFGVLKAGGFYVPLEPSLPAARAQTILDDAGVGVVISSVDRTGWAIPDGVRTVPVDAAGEDVRVGDEADPAPVGDVSTTAYVIFTSGSTGKPKGVAVTHRPLRNLLNWCYRTHGFGPADTGLCVTSLGFDLSVFDILGLLGCGAGLYIADEIEQHDPQLLLDILLREPITFWNSAPTSLNQLAPLFPGRTGAAGTGTLRLVYLSGDYLPLPLPDEVRALFPNARIVSLGGATEATVWSNWYEVGAVDPAWRSVPYGRPIDNARYYLLDERMEPCPPGVAGDLYIGGECLSAGYYRQPELTAERFVPDPFGTCPGGRLYRTGDRASYFDDGTICFLGRADGQVKIRGFRVELAEVEHRLRAHPAVTDVVALARPDRTGDRKLVAYVVPVGDPPPAVGDLRRHAAVALPDYMVPNVVAFVDTFPATANGKLDRDALPWPVDPGSVHRFAPARAPVDPPPAGGVAVAGGGVPDTGEGAAPAGEVSQLAEELAAIFADLLGIPGIGLDEDVWDQGATSYTMVQVSAALQRRRGRPVPVSALLADPTVAGIARALVGPSDAGAPAGGFPSAGTPAHPVAPVPAPDGLDTSAPSGVGGAPAGTGERPGPVDFFSVRDREEFKRARWDLRRCAPGDPVVPLAGGPAPEREIARRASRREFADRPIPYRDFSRLLGLLREWTVDGRRRRHYPSAGDTYAVQVYVHVRPDAVEGVPAAAYYYHPVEDALHLVAPAPAVDRTAHFVYNRPVFDASGVGLYLFGQADAIEPLYGADSGRFLALEAGYLGQVLMQAQTDCGIGLCPVGGVAEDAVRAGLGLDGRHRYLQAFLAGPITPGPAPAIPGDRPATPRECEVAVVGMAGRYPGAGDLATFWRNLSQGTRALGPVPERRWHQIAAAPPAPIGGYLDDIDIFDSLHFRVAPAEAADLDPQCRLLLHTVWECLEDAGHTPDSLRRTGRVGVFLGAMWQDYQHVGADRAQAGARAGISATASEAANRVSHFFGFAGPSVAVDTSCSSSLAAIDLAVRSLRTGECESAVVAAVNLLTHPYHLRLLADLGLLAERLPGGAFDAEAAGWVPGEGVAAVLLRTRVAADRDADTVTAVIEAARIGHLAAGGRFGAPSASALAGTIARTLAAAEVGAEDVGYVECAAAGAALADAAEVEALGEVFAGRRTPVPIGTLKPNIGHLEAAAGLSQLTKVLLQMRHGQLAPTVLAPRSAPLVSWTGRGVRPADRLSPWPASGPRRALVTAVGATGSYGHVVLRAVGPAPAVDAVTPVESAPGAGSAAVEQVVPLSARTAGQVIALAVRLHRYLAGERQAGRAPALADLAYTLQEGRVALRHRMLVRVSTMDELVTALDAAGRGAGHPSVRTGVVEPGTTPPSGADPATGWLAGAEVDWAGYRPAGPLRRVPLPTYPFATDRYRHADPVPGQATDRAGHHHTDPASDHARLAAEDYLTRVYAEVSGVPADELDVRTPLEQYGLSSAQIVALNARLGADLGELPSTLFYAHRDLAGVAGQIAPVFDRRPPTPGVSAGAAPAVGRRPVPASTVAVRDGAAPPAASTSGADRRMAIVGIAGRYPQAPDLAAFWRNLRAGRDAITELPPGRRPPGAGTDRMIGGFIADVDRFDPLFFGITPRDAALMDPQERLFLQVAWHTLEDAGYTRAKLRDRHAGRVGVFVGCMYNEYPFLALEQAGTDGRWTAAGSAIAGIANRVSYFLDLNGPSLTVDTMCSSSLTALHLAVRSLRRGECEAALVGGVNLSLHPNKFVALDQMHMSSSDHRCRSFGAGGDGFVPGEGVGAVLLKPLDRALADADRIHAVVLGTAVNHDGKTNGYPVPNPLAQAALVADALRDAEVGPADIGYVEAHGTGTSLGDPIEIDGLSRVFAPAGLPPAGCAIGSVKSAVGHLEAAAGIAGLTKVVLQFRHRTMVPSLHAGTLNPNIDWTRSPFRVQREAAPWPDTAPRRAGISSFGAGGANAHAVVEAYDGPAPDPEPASGPQILVLSAATADRLREMATRLAAHLRANPVPLPDLAYTLQTGREALKTRLAVVVASVDEALAALDRAGAGAGSTDGPAELVAVARRWVSGGSVDWAALHPGTRRLLDLPGYPFARTRCWVGGEGAEPETPLLVRDWRVEPVPPDPVGATGGQVLCLARPGHRFLADALARALSPARVATVYEDLDYTDLDSARAVLRRYPPVTGVVDLCALPEPGSPVTSGRDEHDAGGWGVRLAILGDVLTARPPGGVRVLQVTSGLLDLPGVPPDLTGARLAGFVRSLGAEYPSVRATVLDIDRPERIEQIVDVWHRPGPYGEIGVRDGVRHRPVLVPAPSPGQLWHPDPDQVYVVSGGTRGLGARAARHLVARGARRLAVLGIRPLPPRHEWVHGDLAGEQAETVGNIRRLERMGAQVMVHTGALTARAEIAGFLATVRASLGPIGGVVHCAGRPSQGPTPLIRKELPDLRAVLAPKTDGLDVLVELTAGDRLEFFLLYSSVSAVVGALGAGVADYAAANAYLDYVARYQVRAGRTCFRSVNWPVWREDGPAPGPDDAARGGHDALARAGLAALTGAAGLAALDRVLALPPGPPVLPAPAGPGGFDPEAALRVNQPLPVPPASTAPAPDAVASTPVVAAPTVAPAPQSVPPPVWLVGLFSRALGIPEADLDPRAAFGDLGVESVLLAQLLADIEAHVGRSLEPATLLDHPTLEALGAHLADTGIAPPTVRPSTLPPATPLAATAPRPASAPPVVAVAGPVPDDRIAVVGMACRLPGAPDLDAYWNLLRDGRCAVTEVPPGRWDVTRLYRPEPAPGRSVSKWGGFVAGVEDFDPEFFGMSEAEAKNLDPAIRLVLEGAAGCLRDAGYRDGELAGDDVGVFVGARMSGYRRRIGVENAAAGLGGDQNFIAARVAHQYDFRGPCMVVDSACSSALVAVHLAVRSLLAGESRVAFAAGVEVLLDEEPYLEFSHARALSPRGRCAAFARDADGFVPGEGCGGVLLKRYPEALRDGDRIHAVIDAVAVGNDGRTMGLTTPNPVAQAQVVRRALAGAGISARRIGMVEAHGTGTMIGDPIELRALTDVFREHTTHTGFCAIGSVKSNLGHLLSAAGIAGLLKVLLAVEHGQIPPTLFCEPPNPRFDFSASPFFPNAELRPWPAGPRTAGVSAFGLGGTNAHLIASAVPESASTRVPLPAPVFRRRRLWWDPVASPGPAPAAVPAVPAPRPAAGPPPGGGDWNGHRGSLVASVLDLRFEPVRRDGAAR